jgi:hypothetical protein
MAYLDAHLAKLRLEEDLQTQRYRNYVEMFDMTQAVQRTTPHPEDRIPIDMRIKGLRQVLRQAETFTLSPQMNLLVAATATEMPSEPLLPQDLPSLQGFLHLPEPFTEIDLHGRLLRQHVVVWSIIQLGNRYGVYINWFTSREDRLDEINRELSRSAGWDKIGKYMLMSTNTLWFGDQLPKSPDPTAVRDLDKLGVLPPDWRKQYLVQEEDFLDIDPETGRSSHNVKYVPVANDDSILTPEQFQLIRQAYSGIAEQYVDAFSLKQLVCFWRLCQQTISGREYVRPNRTLARRLAKRRFAASPVTVITLRRQQHEHGHREIEWDHRWLRRGHWRQQWYGSGLERHQRAIYINPTICGPDDKPLLIRPHVNVLKR